ncbi:MAG: hypothetical protein RLZZ214_2292 [Verrucomicrobiota bacterium]
MTTSRFLPILNLVGCVLITGIILAQWLKERGLDTQIHELNRQLVASRDLYQAEKTRVGALESDIVQLKESIESTVRARKETEEAMGKLVAERDAQSAGHVATSQEQAKIWEQAIADRDAKLRGLNEDLITTRLRLDEAVSRLKTAGAR